MTVIYATQTAVPQPKTRGALLPLLVILFLISYGILTLLVVEQGKTIEAQRSLLREMLKDSQQLATLKDRLARAVPVQSPAQSNAQSNDKAAAATEQKQAVSGSSPSAAPKAPSRETKRPGKSAQIKREAPEKPAADLQDVRRFTRVI